MIYRTIVGLTDKSDEIRSNLESWPLTILDLWYKSTQANYRDSIHYREYHCLNYRDSIIFTTLV